MITLKISKTLYLRVYLEANKAAVEKDDLVVCVEKTEIAPLTRALELAQLYLATEGDAGPTDGTP